MNNVLASLKLLSEMAWAAVGLALLAAVVITAMTLRSQRISGRAGQVQWSDRHDAITGLANRAEFRDHLGSAILHTPDSTAVLYVSLDGFKEVNEWWGRDSGDLVLRAAAKQIASLVRDGEVVAKVGGDEFAILCPGVERTDDVVGLAVSIIRTLGEPIELDVASVRVGASIGLVLAQPDADVREMLAEAERAMYWAKSKGGHCWSTCPAPVKGDEARMLGSG